MLLTNKLWLGAASGAAGMGLFGDQNQDLGDRLGSGALLGLAAGAGAGLVWPGVKAGYQTSKFGGGLYLDAMKGRYTAMREAGAGALKSGLHAYGTRGVFTGLGAVIGASMSDEGHRTRGAVIGGAVGFGARSLVAGSAMYKHLPAHRGLRTGFIAGLSMLAFGVGAAMRYDNNEAVATYSPDGGYDEYAQVPLRIAVSRNACGISARTAR